MVCEFKFSSQIILENITNPETSPHEYLGIIEINITITIERYHAIVLASRASGCLFGHPNPLKAPFRTPNSFVWNFLKCQSQAYN